MKNKTTGKSSFCVVPDYHGPSHLIVLVENWKKAMMKVIFRNEKSGCWSRPMAQRDKKSCRVLKSSEFQFSQTVLIVGSNSRGWGIKANILLFLFLLLLLWRGSEFIHMKLMTDSLKTVAWNKYFHPKIFAFIIIYLS